MRQKLIGSALLICTVWASGCSGITPSNTETERAWCETLQDTLTLPSRQDTAESARALSDAVAFVDGAC